MQRVCTNGAGWAGRVSREALLAVGSVSKRHQRSKKKPSLDALKSRSFKGLATGSPRGAKRLISHFSAEKSQMRFGVTEGDGFGLGILRFHLWIWLESESGEPMSGAFRHPPSCQPSASFVAHHPHANSHHNSSPFFRLTGRWHADLTEPRITYPMTRGSR